MRIDRKALIVAAAFWSTLLVARDVRWGIGAAIAAAAVDWAVLVLPLLQHSTASNRSRS